MSATTDFLQQMLPEGGWSLAAIDPATGKTQHAFFTNVKQAERWILNRLGKRNLYFRPNVRVQGTGRGHSGQASDVAQVHWLFTDIDSYKIGETPQQTYDRLQASTHPPSIVVMSGNGVQAHWHLADPVDYDTACQINQHLIELHRGDDGTYTPERLMRLPGTINIPGPKKMREGRVEVESYVMQPDTGQVYDDYEFPRASIPETHEHILELGDIVSPERLDTLNLPPNLHYLIVSGHDEHDTLKGDRSNYVFKAVCDLIRARVPDETIAGIMLDDRWAISASLLEKGEFEADRAVRRAIKHAYEAGAAPRPTAEEDFDTVQDDGSLEAYLAAEALKTIEHADDKKAKERTKLLGMTCIEIDQLELLPEPEWLVEGIIEEFALAQIIGVQKHGKTHFGVDLALHIAMGLPFYKHKVKRKRVLYIIAEGSTARFYDRVKAWCIEHDIERSELQGWFAVCPRRVTIDKMEEVALFVRANFQQGEKRVGIVFTDTVARNMAGDESAAQDMGAFVAGQDYIRDTMGCAAVVLHHIGKDTSRGGRGSTALPGAVDATIQITKVTKAGKRTIKAEITEMRASEEGERFIYDLVNHTVDDESMRECATLRLTENLPPGARETRDPTSPKEGVLDLLRDIQERGGANTKASLVKDGRSEGQVRKLIKALQDDGLLSTSTPYQPTPKGEKALEGEDE